MQVKKRDGRLEDFSHDKLKSSFTAAGTAEEAAEELTSQVESWAEGAANEGVIETPAIWNKVVEVLEAADPGAAEHYKGYQG